MRYMRQIYRADDRLKANIFEGILEQWGIKDGLGLLPVVSGVASLEAEGDQVDAACRLIDQSLKH